MYDSSLLVRAYRTCRILPGLFEPKPVFQAYLPVVVLHESITGNGRAVHNEVIFKNVKFKHKIFIYLNFISSHIKAIANNRHFEIYFHQFFNDLYPLLKEKVFEHEREIHECFTVTQIDRSKNPENLCYGDVNNDYEKLLENEILSDITFDVNGTRISAHRAILFGNF